MPLQLTKGAENEPLERESNILLDVTLDDPPYFLTLMNDLTVSDRYHCVYLPSAGITVTFWTCLRPIYSPNFNLYNPTHRCTNWERMLMLYLKMLVIYSFYEPANASMGTRR
jgi:hypothetical protein